MNNFMSFKKNKKQKFLLKDKLFNLENISFLAKEIKKNHPTFLEKEFLKNIFQDFSKLELKERIYHIRDTLFLFFQKEKLDFSKQVEIILKSLPKELDQDKQDDDFGDFIYSPFGEYIAKYGCDKKDFLLSISALKEITKRFSCEFPMRDFINFDKKQTLKILKSWSKDKNYHVRRLVSESTRIRLPWGKKINLDYKESKNILNNLYKDKTMYVRRSVANHLHDISKIDKIYVFEILKSWKKEFLKKEDLENLNYIIKHSLRTLIKNGDEKALDFIQVKKNVILKILKFEIKEKDIKLNDYLNFELEIKNLEKQKIKSQINYIIFFADKNGKVNQKIKIYKIKNIEFKDLEILKFKKSHHFKDKMSTIKIYKGDYKIAIQINGNLLEEKKFKIK